MSEGLNRVMLFGNLGADPELKMTQGGTAILKLRVATAERYQDKGGNWQDRTEWHTVVVWGKRGEGLSKILSKGSTVFVEGSLRTTSYEKDGEKRYKTEVVAQKVLLGGSPAGRRDAGNGRRPALPAHEEPEVEDIPDEDIPF